MAQANSGCLRSMGTSLAKVSCKNKDREPVIRSSFPKKIWNTVAFRASKRGHGDYDSHGGTGSSLQREYSLGSDQNPFCGEQTRRSWSLEELFAVEDSFGMAFPAMSPNAGSGHEPRSLLSRTPNSSGRLMDDNITDEAAVISTRIPSDLDSDCHEILCHPSDHSEPSGPRVPEPADGMSLELAEGKEGLEGVGLTLNDVVMLYENDELDEEDVLAFVNATCPGNNFEMSEMLDTIALSIHEL